MDILARLKHPRVRDLAWAIASAPLAAFDNGSLHWPARHWYLSVARDYQDQLLALDRNPEPLLEHLDAHADQRLGTCFERLWHYWLLTGPRYRLLAANLAVREAGRTVGEFDCLVEDRASGKTLHWELAVKFYLGVGETGAARRWFGPALRDRLDLKMQHLQSRQGRLSQQPQARKLLEQQGLRVDETWAIFKGRLFYPDATSGPPDIACSGHERGLWMSRRDFYQRQSAGESWLLLHRRQWFAPLSGTPDNADTRRSVEELDRPVCLARIDKDVEMERAFVVPDGWADRTFEILSAQPRAVPENP